MYGDREREQERERAGDGTNAVKKLTMVESEWKSTLYCFGIFSESLKLFQNNKMWNKDVI